MNVNRSGRCARWVARAVVPVACVVVATLTAGCQADCKTACEKLILDCGAGIPSYNATQCEEDCNAVQTYYETYPYLEDELEAFHEELACIRDADCEALLDPDAPACYNEQLFVFN